MNLTLSMTLLCWCGAAVVVPLMAVKIGSSKWTTNWGVVRKKPTRKMKRLARIFLKLVHCL